MRLLFRFPEISGFDVHEGEPPNVGDVVGYYHAPPQGDAELRARWRVKAREFRVMRVMRDKQGNEGNLEVVIFLEPLNDDTLNPIFAEANRRERRLDVFLLAVTLTVGVLLAVAIRLLYWK